MKYFNPIIFTFLLLFSISYTTYGKANKIRNNYTFFRSKKQSIQQLKYGFKIGVGEAIQVGGSSIYPITQKIGLGIDVAYLAQLYNNTYKSFELFKAYSPELIIPHLHHYFTASIISPITLRFYPSASREAYSFFIGIQPGYISIGEFEIYTYKTAEYEIENGSSFLTLEKITEIVQLNRWQVGLIVGCDYEFASGWNIGFKAGKELIDIIDVEELYTSLQAIFTVGYNFSRLGK